MSHQIKHKRPKYNLEFKQDATKVVLEKNETHQDAADSLGISLQDNAQDNGVKDNGVTSNIPTFLGINI